MISAQIIPGGRVAEKAGDVDQNGVEELVEFIRVDLQVVQIVVEALDRTICMRARPGA